MDVQSNVSYSVISHFPMINQTCQNLILKKLVSEKLLSGKKSSSHKSNES